MHFRSYTPADLESMFQLDALCFSEPFQFDRVTMEQFAEEPGGIVILVDDANEGDPKEAKHKEAAGRESESREDGTSHPARLVAFIILHLEGPPTDSNAYIVTIDVSPDHRRQGIGAAMLDHAEAAARSAGATQISLHVAAENLAAVTFYAHQGYQRTGLAKRFYREAGQDALIFAKPL